MDPFLWAGGGGPDGCTTFGLTRLLPGLIHDRNRAASFPGCYVLRLSCSFELGHFMTRRFPCCAGYLLLRWFLSRGFDCCVGLCLASWWVALRRLAWPCLHLPRPANARRSPPSSRTASGRRRGWCPPCSNSERSVLLLVVWDRFERVLHRPEGSTHCYIALSLSSSRQRVLPNFRRWLVPVRGSGLC